MTRVAIPGFTRGRATYAKMPYSESPSILAASSSSLGTPIMNCRIRNTPNPENACISIRPRWESVRPILEISAN